jgi:hypothetical protein
MGILENYCAAYFQWYLSLLGAVSLDSVIGERRVNDESSGHARSTIRG